MLMAGIKYMGMFVVGSSLSLSIKVNPSGHVCGGSRVRFGNARRDPHIDRQDQSV